MSLSQDERIGKLTTPLGDNVLALSRFDGGERYVRRLEKVAAMERMMSNG